MRYILLTLLVLLTACGDTAPPPPVDVPALQTQAAALNAVATARAALIVPTLPPVEATRDAVFWQWGHALLAGRWDDTPPTRTALAATWQPAQATLTALPTRIVP
jgi:hypothetical protein